ncbi:MAG: glycosyltransferase family 2 protein [Acidobacteria bacterium]|nr:MAG: glycosyltransferase family 2 protein [Acidobacteriota bacterium]
MPENPIPADAPAEAGPTIDVVIPAYNEAGPLTRVLGDLPQPPVRRVVVADNNSTDVTADIARRLGAVVVPAPRQGYGSACLEGLDYLRRHDPPQIVVFLDADYSDDPRELPRLVAPIVEGRADLVIGSRVERAEPGALLPQARFGNFVACCLMRLLYGHRFTDLGPFRAIRWTALERLGMRDPDFGWTAEMQVKALRHGLSVAEVPVSYRRRIGGASKITGTLRGTLLAGYKILSTVLRYRWGK